MLRDKDVGWQGLNLLTDCQAPIACLDSLDRVTPDHIAETRNANFFRPCFPSKCGTFYTLTSGCRVVCCVKGKRRVSTEMGRRYLPRGQGMFCLDDAKRLDRHPWQLDVNRHLGCGIIGIFHVHGLYIQIIPSMCGNEILRSILLCDLALSSRCPPSENIAGTRTLAHHTLPGISCCVGSVGLDHCC